MSTTFKSLITILFFMIALDSSGNEMVERSLIKEEVKRLFFSQNFDQLELRATQFKSSKERTSSGLWRLTVFYWGFDEIVSSYANDERAWKNLFSIVNEWISTKPDSTSVVIAKGIILQRYAWKFRGDSWAKNVPKEAWEPFRRNLEIAKTHMIENKIKSK